MARATTVGEVPFREIVLTIETKEEAFTLRRILGEASGGYTIHVAYKKEFDKQFNEEDVWKRK